MTAGILAKSYSIGSILLVKDFRKKRWCRKLDCPWRGPYVITSSLAKDYSSSKKEIDGDHVGCLHIS